MARSSASDFSSISTTIAASAAASIMPELGSEALIVSYSFGFSAGSFRPSRIALDISLTQLWRKEPFLNSIDLRDAIVRIRPAPFAALVVTLQDGAEIRVGRTYTAWVRNAFSPR